MKSKLWFKIVVGLVTLFVVIQFYPYGRDHENPPVTYNVEWDNPLTKETFYNACADCHSNETNWPWYSNIAPVSWLIQSDVNDGRRHFNISTYEGMDESEDAYKLVEKGVMPLDIYLPLHPEANLDDEEKQLFVAGLKATFNKQEPAKE